MFQKNISKKVIQYKKIKLAIAAKRLTVAFFFCYNMFRQNQGG